MIVYLAAARRSTKKDVDLYRQISHVIHDAGHTLPPAWGKTGFVERQNKEAETGMEAAEVIIVEASDPGTLSVGYELAIALQKRKPILALVNKRVAREPYVSTIQQDLLTVKEYNSDTLARIIKEFLSDNTVRTKDLRFNFVIDRRMYNHLRLKSFNSGRTKAELLRDLLIKDIEKEG